MKTSKVYLCARWSNGQALRLNERRFENVAKTVGACLAIQGPASCLRAGGGVPCADYDALMQQVFLTAFAPLAYQIVPSSLRYVNLVEAPRGSPRADVLARAFDEVWTL